MQRSWKRAELLPLKCSLLIMFFTLFVYLFGPIRWIKEWNASEIITIMLLCAYFTAFAVGYLFRLQVGGISKKRDRDLAGEKTWQDILNVTVFVNLILTIGNALLYSNVGSLDQLFNKAVQGIVSSGSVYYAKDASSRANSIIVWITMIYSPFLYLTNVLSIYSFKQLTRVRKICVILTFVVEIARWLSVGTNKGLFDIVLLFVSYYIVLRMLFYGKRSKRTRKNRRRIIIITCLIVAVIVLFFVFFGTAMASRVGGVYDEDNYRSFPYSLVPEGMRFFLEKFDSYLVQGYDNLEKIIKHCEFRWTFGLGNSRFLMDIVNRLTGINLTGRTYPYQLEYFGVDPLASWHSAYAWFASDLTFIGVILLMVVAGYYMSSLVIDVIVEVDPISMALLYLMIMMVFNASCTNYVLAYTNGFIGFWGLAIMRFLKKHNVRFVLHSYTLRRKRSAGKHIRRNKA